MRTQDYLNFSAVEAVQSIPAVTNILDIICKTTGMGFSAVANVTESRWMACAVQDEINFGLKAGGELELETTICHEIRQHKEPVIINHVAEDEQWASHHTPLLYGFQSYISVPIFLKDGLFFGTLCAIDPNPHVLDTPEIKGTFKLFAELIAFHLDAMSDLAKSEAKLLAEQEVAELREQFIAILGHDLRNPIGAISNASQLLLRMPLEDKPNKLSHIIQDASYRIRGLIDNMLDFASGRMGDGIVLKINENEPVEKILSEVITELKMVWPTVKIEEKFEFIEPVNCDGKRIAQLFSNLLANAITHGKKDAPINVSAQSIDGIFSLAISNQGEQIQEKAMHRLFQPFSRGEVKPGQQGLGLGLYIASEIAAAHAGKLTVDSTPQETTFTLSFACK